MSVALKLIQNIFNHRRKKKLYRAIKLIFDHMDWQYIWFSFRGFKVFESDRIQINKM